MAPTTIVDADLRPSRELGVLVASAHVVAAASPWLAGLPVGGSVAIGLLVLGWGWHQVRRIAALRGRDAVTRFRLHGDGRIVVLRRTGEAVEGECLGIELLGRMAAVVRFHETGKGVVHLVAWRDQCDARTLRRLRIAARWNAGIATTHAPRGLFGESRDLA